MKTKSIKQITALLLAFVLLALPAGISAETESDTYKRADALLDVLIGEPFSAEETAVTRADFLMAAARLFQIENAGNAATSFSDVSGTLTATVNAALAMGWISDGEQFRPNEPITYQEAVKIAVCAAGYKFIAESRGGYPAGYLSVAVELKLTRDSVSGQTLSAKDAKLLLFQLIQTNVFEATTVGSEDYYYDKAEDTYLNRLYHIDSTQGIVNATPYNSLDFTVSTCKEGYICIDGVEYEYDNATADLLGRSCYAYYEEDMELRTLVCLVPYKNDEISLNLEDIIDLEGRTLKYDDAQTGKSNRLTLESGWMLIYNGRPASVDERYLTGSGTVRLLDNDGDGSYDYLFVDRCRYIIVDSVDVQKKTVADKNDPNSVVDLEAYECIYSISDTEGEALTLYDIDKGSVVAVRESADGLLVSMTVCSQTVSGIIEEIAEEKVVVEGNIYRLSDYFKTYYSEQLEAGLSGTFTVGVDGTFVTMEQTDDKFEYAYLIAAKQQGFGKAEIKIYPAGGPVTVCTVADKLTVDGKMLRGNSKNEWLAAVENGSITPQLVRVARNANGEISHLDLAETGNEVDNPQQLPYDNKLLKYQFPASSFIFRNTPQICASYFNVSGSIIFKVPKDLTEDTGFFTVDSGSLNDGSSYSFEVYDLDEYGGAAVLVLEEDSKNPNFGTADASYIVEKIVTGAGPDGEAGRNVYCWSNGQFYKYFLSNDVTVSKSNHKDLLPGDIIRLHLDSNDCITALCVDFEGETRQANTLSNAAFSSSGTFSYQTGGLYRGSGNYVYLSNVTDGAGNIDYSFGNLRNYHINTEYIIRYDSAEQTLRPITAEELKSYCAYGEENSYLVIRTQLYRATCIFVYE